MYLLQALRPPVSDTPEFCPLPLVISSGNCTKTVACDIPSSDNTRSSNVKAIVKACIDLISRGSAPFDLVQLPQRAVIDLAASPTLPLTLVHNVEYVQSLAAIYNRNELPTGAIPTAPKSSYDVEAIVG